MEYKLYCGKFEYAVNPEVKKTLEGLIYWSHVREQEMKGDNIHAQQEADQAVKDLMDRCEELKVPNWVGNGAMQFGRDNDLRSHYISEFFEESKYSEKGHKKIQKERER